MNLLLFGDKTVRPSVDPILPIRADGRVWRDTVFNAVWYWRGYSWFRAFGRFLAGETLTADLSWFHAHRVNTVRVWPSQDGGANRTYDRPDFDERLSQFVALLTQWSLYVEFTPITEYHRPFDEDVRTAQRVYDVVQGRPNVFVELVNEPRNVNYDVFRLAGAVNRRGVLSAYGYDPIDWGYTTCPRLDYVTTHLPRDLEHYYRNSKDIEEMHLGCPVIDDEPLGIAEYDKVGSGARSTDQLSHVSHFGIARLYAAGATIHSQAGLEGRVPGANERTTERICSAISDMWHVVPDYTPAGDYVRAPGGHTAGDGGDFAVVVTRDDLEDGRGYGSSFPPAEQFVVLPQSAKYQLRPGFVAVPRGSWTGVKPIGSNPGIYRAFIGE